MTKQQTKKELERFKNFCRNLKESLEGYLGDAPSDEELEKYDYEEYIDLYAEAANMYNEIRNAGI